MEKSNFYGVLDSQYILEHMMGDGISSKVYKAQDSSGKEYAIKVFEKYTSSIEKEILFNKIITSSNSPFFIKYISSSSGFLDTDEFEKNKHYIIFELAQKGELFDYITCNKTGFQETNCKLIMYKILLAIQTLHKIGICHRDIKAQNILLLGDNYEIKICDLGNSSFIYGKNGKVLQKGEFGTVGYMAPEVIEGNEYDGEKADIFSIGVLLFTLRTCSIPFVIPKIIYKGTTKEKLYNYINNNSNYYWIIRDLPGLSEEYKNLFIKMVAYDPNKRPTIEEILNDDWMKEITNLKKDEFIQYEKNLIKEFKLREDIMKIKNE